MLASFFRDKKRNLIFTLLFSFCFILISIFIYLYYFYDYQITNVIGNKEINRGLEVITNSNLGKEYLDTIEEIEYYRPIYSNQIATYNSKLIQINSNHNNNFKYGRDVKAEDELVISYYYYLNLKLNEEDVGKIIISIDYNAKQYDFKLVGVVNDNLSNIYISNDSLENIFSLEPNDFYVLVNDYNNISKVKSELEKLDFQVDNYDTTGFKEIDNAKKIQKNYFYILIFSAIIFSIFINNTIKSIISSEQKNIAIFIAIGYKYLKIKIALLTKIIVIIITSLILSSILQSIILFILNSNIFNILFILKLFIFEFIISILIIILDTITFRHKVKKMNILSILSEE